MEIRIPIDLGEKIIYVELEEVRKNRDLYKKLLYKRTGKELYVP